MALNTPSYAREVAPIVLERIKQMHLSGQARLVASESIAGHLDKLADTFVAQGDKKKRKNVDITDMLKGAGVKVLDADGTPKSKVSIEDLPPEVRKAVEPLMRAFVVAQAHLAEQKELEDISTTLRSFTAPGSDKSGSFGFRKTVPVGDPLLKDFEKFELIPIYGSTPR